MYRSFSRSPCPKRYAWESDQSRSPDRRPVRRQIKDVRYSPPGRRSPGYSPPVHRRSDSRQNRRRERSRSRRRNRSPAKGKGKSGTCFDFIRKKCRLGDRCPFPHPDEEERKRVKDILSRQPCKRGAQCTRPDCLYQHPDDDKRKRSSGGQRSGSSGSRSRGRSSSEPKVTMMKAVGLKSYGEISVIEDLFVPKPELDSRSRDLLVRIRGSDMNSLDLQMREGAHSKELSAGGYRILGYASAGVIEEMSDAAKVRSKLKVGDEVWFANTWDPSSGSNQEYCCIDHRLVSAKPFKLASFADAAAIPLVALTAWGALVEHMRMDLDLLEVGSRPPRFTFASKGVFFALPGGSGIGSFALQLAAKYLNRNNNLIIIASASRPESVEWCKKMGAHHVINHNAFSFKDELDKIGIKGLDYVIYGMPPSKHEDKLYEAMNPLGQITSYHEGSFEKMESCRPKRISFHQECTDVRPMLEHAPERVGEVLDTVAKLFDDPTVYLESVVTQKFPELTAETLRTAHARQILRSSDGDVPGKTAFEINK